MIALHQADGFGFRSAFEHLRPAAQFQILDQDDTVAVREHVAVGVLDDADGVRCIRPGFTRLFVTAGDALMAFRIFQHLGHLAHRTGRFAHKETG